LKLPTEVPDTFVIGSFASEGGALSAPLGAPERKAFEKKRTLPN